MVLSTFYMNFDLMNVKQKRYALIVFTFATNYYFFNFFNDLCYPVNDFSHLMSISVAILL